MYIHTMLLHEHIGSKPDNREGEQLAPHPNITRATKITSETVNAEATVEKSTICAAISGEFLYSCAITALLTAVGMELAISNACAVTPDILKKKISPSATSELTSRRKNILK